MKYNSITFFHPLLSTCCHRQNHFSLLAIPAFGVKQMFPVLFFTIPLDRNLSPRVNFVYFFPPPLYIWQICDIYIDRRCHLKVAVVVCCCCYHMRRPEHPFSLSLSLFLTRTKQTQKATLMFRFYISVALLCLS